MVSTERMLTRRDVEQATGFSRSSLYRKMRENSFPLPIKTGERAVRWPESEIVEWLSERPRATGEINDPTQQRRAETKTPTVNEVFNDDGSTHGDATQRS